MLKLARRARGHFVTLIEIRVHLIRVKPGHISILCCRQLQVNFIFIILHGKEFTIQDLEHPRLQPLSILVKEDRVNDRHNF